MRRFLLVWLGLLGLALLWPRPSAAAANFNYQVQVNYRIEAASTQVEETYTVINRTPRQYLTELKLTTPTDQISAVKATYSDGGNIPVTTATKRRSNGFESSQREITLKFPRVYYGQGRRWNFKLRYQATGLVDQKGSAYSVYVPAIDPGDAADTYTATIDVPASFGTPHFSGAQAASGGVRGDRQVYSFDKAELVDHSLALAFGDKTIYRTQFSFPLHNPTPLPKTLTIALPPDLNNQTVQLHSLNPAPRNTRLDEDGNVLADYRLSPGQKLTVVAKVSGEVRYLDYNLSSSATKRDIPQQLVKRYTKATKYWPTSGEVAQAATSVSDPAAPVVNNVKAIYRYVIDKLNYNNAKIEFNIRQGAAKALANPDHVVCLEYADLLVAMLRSQGIPARMPVGYGYSDDLKQTAAVSDSLHAWVEAYVPGVGWMTLDPTWGEKFDQFGHSDLDHFAFAVWGGEDERPAAVMLGRQDMNYQYEQTKLEFAAAAAPSGGSMQARVTRFLLLPFVWLEHVVVESPAGAASDDNWVEIGSQRFDLGSLAPLQRLTFNQLNFESRATLPVRLGRSGAQPVLLAAAHTSANYWPAWALAAALVIAALIWVVIRLRAHEEDHLSVVSESYD